jgi:putative transposase
VRANQAVHRVATMCRVLGVSTSGYYAWLKRPPSRRARKDLDLTVRIRTAHDRSRGTYGAPRILRDLRDEGEHVSLKRIARLMRSVGIQGVSRRKRFRTTRPDGKQPLSPDLVERDFHAEGPNRLWVADITYVPTMAGFVFLAVVLDAWSRRVVGWAMASHLRTELVLTALEMAIKQRQPGNVVHHSDHGCQYTSYAFGKRCEQAGVRPSMGSVGDCFDNAMCESFFASLECELLDRRRFESQSAARLAVFEYIEGFYNPTRRHSALDYDSPMTYEMKHWPVPLRASA